MEKFPTLPFIQTGFSLGLSDYLVNLFGVETRIVIDPDVCNGRPTIRGTRVAAQTVLEFLGAGDSIEDVLKEYPSLTREDIMACLNYASRLLANHYLVISVA